MSNEKQIDDVPRRVKQLIAESLNVELDKVQPHASFIDDLGADSLDIVEMVMAFERAFNIEIPDEDAEKISTVGDAIQYMQNRNPAN